MRASGCFAPVRTAILPIGLALCSRCLIGCVKDRSFEDLSSTPPPPGIRTGVVRINEIVATGSTYMSEFGQATDWFELYNPDTVPFVMQAGKWFFSDNADAPTEFPLQTALTLPAHGFVVICCDSRDTTAAQVHTNFNLSSSGESVLLHYNDGNASLTIDSHAFPAQTPGHSSGRIPDGGPDWSDALAPTPAGPNHP